MSPFIQVAFALLTFGSALCLYRIGRGPSAPDRAISIDILGTLVVGFCCLMAIWTNQEFYMNIAIAWALISYVATLALGKYLEGRPYDD